MASDGEITALLTALEHGDSSAMERLLPLVYSELRERAHGQRMRRGSSDTLSTTALVHEAYLKLTGGAQRSYNDRAHFFAVASRAMRHILVDDARRNMARKRKGERASSVDLDLVASPERAEELVALDGALAELEQVDDRLARTVELRFFGGLSVEETADLLGISPRTVKRDWRKARAFLYRAMQSERPQILDGPESD
jgi:RNA polymerase sigma factor (TIGR02999 family)